MEQSGNLLLSIINNVLDMARIESGKVELDEDYVKIRDIYQGIYKIFQAEAEKKCIHLKMEYDVKHEHVICDETKNKENFPQSDQQCGKIYSFRGSSYHKDYRA